VEIATKPSGNMRVFGKEDTLCWIDKGYGKADVFKGWIGKHICTARHLYPPSPSAQPNKPSCMYIGYVGIRRLIDKSNIQIRLSKVFPLYSNVERDVGF